MTPPRKKSSGASRGKGKSSTTPRRESSGAKPKSEAEPAPAEEQAEETGTAPVDAEASSEAAIEPDPIALEPGVDLPAPQPPADAREAREMAAAEQRGEADGAPEGDPDASADPAPEPPPVPAPATTALRDAVDEVPLESEPKKGYARGRVVLGEHLYYVKRKGGSRRAYTAPQGTVLELPKAEIARGIRVGGITDASEPPPAPPSDPLDLDDEALAEWVGSHTIDEVIPWATNVERANRLLEAERKSNTDPRVGILRGIEAVLSSGAL